MDKTAARRKRLEQLIRLAEAYRGVSRREIAGFLGRDATRLVPQSGVPKLDLVAELARVLDWSIGDVGEYLWNDDRRSVEVDGSKGFEELQRASREAHVEGNYSIAARLAKSAFVVAETPNERALACIRECAAWDGLGLYTAALETEQRGLQQGPIERNLRCTLQVNLASSYYTLGALYEARSVAWSVVEDFRTRPPADTRDRVANAFALYVRGSTSRRLVVTEPETAHGHAKDAATDLTAAIAEHERLAEQLQCESHAGIANTCRGGLIETQVELGQISPERALATFDEGLAKVVDPQSAAGDWLESYGWWCIFACNVALRHITDERALHAYLGKFTNKADEIAHTLGNWALRERVFTMEYVSNERFLEWTGRNLPITLDRDDLHALVGAMGRFPSFRPTGWRLLEAADIVDPI